MIATFFHDQLNYYLPSLILSATVLLLVLLTAYKRNQTTTTVLATIGLAAALVAQVLQIGMPSFQTFLFVFDGVSALVSSAIIFAGLMITLLLNPWLKKSGEDSEEYFMLTLLAVEGAVTVTSSNHFASFFLGLELMGLSFIAMIAYEGKNNRALEAGIKYLVLSSTASAFMLLAIAILYFYTGTLSIPEVLVKMADLLPYNMTGKDHLIQNAAIILLLIGIAFKLSLVPAHLWAADVFEGSPLPTNALLASISKASVFVVLLRLFSVDAFASQHAVIEIIAVIAAASMLIGNLLGVMQRNILRLMAYSSIAHFGYILLVILAIGQASSTTANGESSMVGSAAWIAIEAALYYLIAYVITVTGFFAMLMLVPKCTTIDDLTGLLWQKPAVSCALIVLLLSLAGIPLTVGFISKFYLTLAAVNNQLWWLLGALVTGSVIGLFYYLRIILLIADKPVEAQTDQPAPSGLKYLHLFVILVFISLILGIGILPNGLSELIHSAISI